MPKRIVILLISLWLSVPTVAATLGAPAPVSAAVDAAVVAAGEARHGRVSATASASAAVNVSVGEPELPTPPAPPKIPNLLGPWARATIDQGFAGAEVSGTILLRGTAAAEEGFALRNVVLYVDRVRAGWADGRESWTYALDTRLLVDGRHDIRACASASPSGIPTLVSSGACADLSFSSLNHVPSIVLFERTVDVEGAMADAWVHVLDQDVSGLRVTFEYERNDTTRLPARGMLEVAYQRLPDADPEDPQNASFRPIHGWIATYGPLQGSASWTQSPGLIVRHPAALLLAGEYAGHGRFTVRVEAVPVASDA